MQVKKKPKKTAKAVPEKSRKKKQPSEDQIKKQPFLKRMLFGEEKPDLSELEAGSTTILDILSPTTVDTKSRDYIIVDDVYHAYLYITGYGYTTTVGTCWLAPLVEAGEGINLSFLVKRQPKEKILSKIAQTTMVNRSRMRDVGDTRQDYEELDSAISSGLYLKDVMNRQGENFYYMHTLIEVTAPDPETLEQRVTEVEKLCVSVDMIARRCDYKNEQAFLSALPILALDPDIERNHTNFGKDTQRAFLFAGASYADIIEELKARDEKRDAKLIRYSEAYRGLHYPVHLLSCDETGARQLQIMAVPDYRVKLAKLMLRSAYRPPPEDAPAWDAIYQNRPFVIGADMNLRRIDAAIASAKKRGCLPISLAALDAQGDAVLLRRYKDTGYAVIYKVTESVLTELFGHPPSLYLPPCTQYLTKKGDVVDAPLIQVDRKDRGSPRK